MQYKFDFESGKRELTEEQIARINQIKADIKQLLKSKNADSNRKYKLTPEEIDAQQAENTRLLAENYEQFEQMKEELKSRQFPGLYDGKWVINKNIIAHTVGKNRHEVTAKILEIDLLLSSTADDFFCEAYLVHCPTCNKDLQKRIYLFNNVTNQASYKDFIYNLL